MLWKSVEQSLGALRHVCDEVLLLSVSYAGWMWVCVADANDLHGADDMLLRVTGLHVSIFFLA